MCAIKVWKSACVYVICVYNTVETVRKHDGLVCRDSVATTRCSCIHIIIVCVCVCVCVHMCAEPCSAHSGRQRGELCVH